MTAGRGRRKRGIPPPWEFPPALLPGPDSPVPGPAGANARHGPLLAATGIGAAALLGLSLSARPGSLRFYILTTGLAGMWATGALSSGPLPLGRPGSRPGARTVVMPVLTGAAAFGLFSGAARLAQHIPPLSRAIGNVLEYADGGARPLVLLIASTSAVAEELFFRGALWTATRPHPLITTTLAYAATTAATRNPALLLAGTATSVLFGLQRRTTGGILAPTLSHVTWSLLMLTCLPPPGPPGPAGRAGARRAARRARSGAGG